MSKIVVEGNDIIYIAAEVRTKNGLKTTARRNLFSNRLVDASLPWAKKISWRLCRILLDVEELQFVGQVMSGEWMVVINGDL